MKTATFTAKSKTGVEIDVQADNTSDGIITNYPVKRIPENKTSWVYVISLNSQQVKEFLGVDIPADKEASVKLVDQERWSKFVDDCRRERYETEQAQRETMFPGISAIESARNDEERWRNQFERMMEDENNDGVNPPKAIKISSKELIEQYPKAAAYLKAEGWTCSSNYAKANAGKKAKKRLENGENYEKVIAEMEQEWSKYTADHIWD